MRRGGTQGKIEVGETGKHRESNKDVKERDRAMLKVEKWTNRKKAERVGSLRELRKRERSFSQCARQINGGRCRRNFTL